MAVNARHKLTDGEISVLQSAGGLAVDDVLDVAVRQLAVGVERGRQLRPTACTQHHVERRLVRTQLTFSRLHARTGWVKKVSCWF